MTSLGKKQLQIQTPKPREETRKPIPECRSFLSTPSSPSSPPIATPSPRIVLFIVIDDDDSTRPSPPSRLIPRSNSPIHFSSSWRTSFDVSRWSLSIRSSFPRDQPRKQQVLFETRDGIRMVVRRTRSTMDRSRTDSSSTHVGSLRSGHLSGSSSPTRVLVRRRGTSSRSGCRSESSGDDRGGT